MKWNFNVSSDGLDLHNDSEVLQGISGSFAAVCYDYKDLHSVTEICEKSHPSFGLKLEIYAPGQNWIRHLDRFPPILERLVKLTATIAKEGEFAFLNMICKSLKFDLVLHIEHEWQLLRSFTLIPQHVVGLGGRLPTKDDLSWLQDKVGKQNGFPLALELEDVDNVRDLSDLASSTWILSRLTILKPLREEEDILLFKHICRKHPPALYEVKLEPRGLLELLLRNFPTGIRVSLPGEGPIICEASYKQGLEIKCEEHGYLSCLRNVDLSSLRVLDLNLVADYDPNNGLLHAVSQKSPNLKVLKINTSRSGNLGEFPGLLQRALVENWKNVNTFTITNINSNFFDISLPNFSSDTWKTLRRWRRI